MTFNDKQEVPGHDPEVMQLAEQWERNATEDPLWAILSDPTRAGRPWTEAEFFATGREEWARVARLLDDLEAWPAGRERFLDFGCGVGRMSRQLRPIFRSGVGIDISERMIEAARQFQPDIEFVVNLDPDLRILDDGSVDFIYSHIVLQHVSPGLQESFIGEFMRTLSTGGVAAFQVATEIGRDHRPPWRRAMARLPRPLRTALKRLAGRATTAGIDLEMHAIPHDRVVQIVEDRDGTVLAAPFTNSADSGHNGAIRFFDRHTAIDRLDTEPGASPILSRFYVVRAADAASAGPVLAGGD